MSWAEIAGAVGAAAAAYGSFAGGRHIIAQARQVRRQTQDDPMAAANAALVASLAEAREDITALREDQREDRAQQALDRQRMSDLEMEARRDRQALREAMWILAHPVTTILDWLDAGASPPAPHESAQTVRRRIAALDRDLSN